MLKFVFLIIFGGGLLSEGAMEISPYQPAPSDYILGRGDKVQVDIYGASQIQLSEDLNVREQITIPGFGPITLGGMTPEAASKKLKQTLGKRYADSDVMLTLTTPRRIQVKVSGEVKMPGQYLIHGYSNPLHALHAAGGIPEYGSMRDVVVIKKDGREIHLDLYDYILGKKDLTPLRLDEGDEVKAISYKKLVTIDGLVKRPATYELKEGENLQDLINYADGLVEQELTIRIHHRGAEANRVEGIGIDETKAYIPQDGDVVTAEKRADDPNQVVHVFGNVQYTGQYYCQGENMRTLKEVLRVAKPKVSAKRNAVIVYRDTTLIQTSDDDMQLQGREQIYVMSNVLRVHGEILTPTDIDYHEGITIAECIKAAGGYTKRAARKKVYIVTPDNKIHPSNSNPALIPGSTIVVPKR